MAILNSKSGQTSLEYLLLLALVFVTAYIIMTKPIANLTKNFIGNVRSGLQNVIENAEWSSEDMQPGSGNHPSSPKRLKAEHL